MSQLLKSQIKGLTAVPLLILLLHPVACAEYSDLRLNIRVLSFHWSEPIKIQLSNSN